MAKLKRKGVSEHDAAPHVVALVEQTAALRAKKQLLLDVEACK